MVPVTAIGVIDEADPTSKEQMIQDVNLQVINFVKCIPFYKLQVLRLLKNDLQFSRGCGCL